ncbi:MAG: single-stranded-DNA-specific exonuclease RecJ [Fidelibacterota bacterium]|nr:MAG: single-stranded-DNA-specific exonuclease RecJ [Candidatus Neomarinimicrobiota bacterium]
MPPLDFRWEFTHPAPQLIRQARQAFDVPEIYARVLAGRGIVDRMLGAAFFNPGLEQLHDPFLMRDMDRAADRVLTQVRTQQPILIFGDYDVDGTTGAAMLYLFLTSIGARVSTYIPNRETEGYGLSSGGIDYAALIGADLLITCDCGINAVELVARAGEQGIDTIITDHHTPGRVLPTAAAILNPKRVDDTYPFEGLCGGGVAFKLALAVAEKGGYDPDLVWSHADLIALGTAADMVPILDENRVLVKEGLRLIEEQSRPGLSALWQVAGLSGKEVTVGRLVFGIAPRINAAGRLGDASRAVDLLTTQNRYRAMSIARELHTENIRRQIIQEDTVEEAIFQVNAYHDLSREKALVLSHENWHQGVIGIVAARIRDHFHRPTVIVAIEEGIGKGSARSMAGFDLYEALTHCQEHLLGYGGHAVAAGLSVQAESLPAFTERFLAWADDKLTEEQLQPTLLVEGECTWDLIDDRFLRFLDSLSPFGPGNRRPIFVTRGVYPAGSPRLVGDSAAHLKCQFHNNGTALEAIGFDMADHYEKLLLNKPLDIAYVVEENEWQGNRKVQLQLKDIKMGELP